MEKKAVVKERYKRFDLLMQGTFEELKECYDRIEGWDFALYFDKDLENLSIGEKSNDSLGYTVVRKDKNNYKLFVLTQKTINEKARH